MSSPLRVGIIGESGSGDYGHKIHLGFAACKDIEILALSDANATEIDVIGDQLGVTHRYLDYRDMLRKTELDAVVVATRNIARHHEYVVAALQAGLHVYCEKPMAQDLVQADSMTDCAQRMGLKLAVALPGGHEPRFLDVLRRIDNGEIGEILSTRGICKWDHRGGGEDAFVLGMHFSDLSRRILGDVIHVYGQVSQTNEMFPETHSRDGAEGVGLVAGDHFYATCKHKNGKISTIESHKSQTEDRALQPYRLEIYGTKGTIVHRAPYADGSTYISRHVVPHPNNSDWKLIHQEADNYKDHHTRAAYNFASAINSKTPLYCSGIDGMKAMEVIHAAYLSSRTNQVIDLPLTQRAHPLVSTNK
ncbi:putative dehydrogenase [Arthrobacter sp. JUb119]|uniref:Gfo/Idh/MocA family protein n=1 Tax=Arthrobacter sp. JUb115 TaxID=2485108 RepID=UPI0010E2B822|nr:Gfo/Idh/MocA family oxidoreductase [Arthrobacter sp. JUb115]MCS3494384.1 putative dehydrogenase [Arthrobacter sp. JUb119]TDU22478.1 putative dehydrogenase [Arthrobacter sp. JUb115]